MEAMMMYPLVTLIYLRIKINIDTSLFIYQALKQGETGTWTRERKKERKKRKKET